jgi:hypothetical protein
MTNTRGHGVQKEKILEKEMVISFNKTRGHDVHKEKF